MATIEGIAMNSNGTYFINCVETERIFKGSELQVRHTIDGKWENAITNPNDVFRLKPCKLIKQQELESQISQLQNQLKNL